MRTDDHAANRPTQPAHPIRPFAARALLSCGLLALPAGALVATTGCASTGITMREKVLGQAKRDQLVNRVEEARDEQEQAKQQFRSALDEFLAVTNAGSDPSVKELETRYRSLEREYERSKDAADDVRGRIRAVENVAGALFSEWSKELALYNDAQMRSQAERQLRDTRRQYDDLLQAMKDAEARMDPVLRAFQDQVLFLKHNLNARAIASLGGTARQIQSDVQRLIREMEASINQANEFINQMGKS